MGQLKNSVATHVFSIEAMRSKGFTKLIQHFPNFSFVPGTVLGVDDVTLNATMVSCSSLCRYPGP